jgi:predicted nucleotide-binding protein
MKNEVMLLLHEAGLRPIVLADQPNQGKTLIEKLLHHAEQAYVLVLLSPDDVGGPKGTPPERLQGRARQNVILELGLFVGLLGRSRVGVLYKPGVELPTDVIGLAYISYENIDVRPACDHQGT